MFKSIKRKIVLLYLISIVMVGFLLINRNMIKNISDKLANLVTKDRFLLVLVTSWKLSPDKTSVYENTASIWSKWPLIVKPILYISPLNPENADYNRVNTYLAKYWEVKNIPKVTCGQIPVLKSMLLDALDTFPGNDFYGFANSDILFDEGLIKTLKSIKEIIPANRPILVVGQRINVNFMNHRHISHADSLLQLAESGVIMKGVAIDYFITNREFPWRQILDLAIGRIHYDNWLVYFAISQNVTVIDATETLTAVHQTTSDGNNAGWHHPNKYCNTHIIKSQKKIFRKRWGYTWCISHYTMKLQETNAIVIRQRAVSPSCKPS